MAGNCFQFHEYLALTLFPDCYALFYKQYEKCTSEYLTVNIAQLLRLIWLRTLWCKLTFPRLAAAATVALMKIGPGINTRGLVSLPDEGGLFMWRGNLPGRKTLALSLSVPNYWGSVGWKRSCCVVSAGFQPLEYHCQCVIHSFIYGPSNFKVILAFNHI